MKSVYALIAAITLPGFIPADANASDKSVMPKATMSKATMSKATMSKATMSKKGETTLRSAPENAAPKATLTPSQEDRLLTLLNTGTKDELGAINGIAATRAESIISARPFQKVHEIILVPGVGNATFERIMAHGKALSQSGAKSGKS